LENLRGCGFVKIKDHTELDVFNMAFNGAMEIFILSIKYPKEEKIKSEPPYLDYKNSTIIYYGD